MNAKDVILRGSTDRYRSITKQFFRKADGVVVVYDITSELTFTAVRHWLASVQVMDSFPLSLSKR